MEKVILTKTFLLLVTISEQNMNNFFRHTMEADVMVLIKNVTTTSKGDRYLRAQHYTILTKVVDEAT
jgi:hypothetical protein